MADPQKWDSEAQLCDAFASWARKGGCGREPWTVYPETGGFDLLLVNKTGHQLGIEAKLSMNPRVCVQSLPSLYAGGEGPDWRGILVPKINGDLAELMKIHGVVIFTPALTHYRSTQDFNPWLYKSDCNFNPWFDWNPVKRCALPEMVPDVAAGVPSPVRMTQWKEAALKVLAHIEAHGFITAKQVKSYGVDSRRFCASDGWLISLGDGRWGRGNVPSFDKQHPTEYAVFLERVSGQTLLGETP